MAQGGGRSALDICDGPASPVTDLEELIQFCWSSLEAVNPQSQNPLLGSTIPVLCGI